MPTFSPAKNPHIESELSREYRILEAEFGDGYKQMAADGLNNVRRKANLSFRNLTTTQKDDIITFMDARGGWESFDYTIPGEASATQWRCKEPINERQVSGGVWDLDLVFEQSFAIS